MNPPEQNNQLSTSRHDNMDALLEKLPAAYDSWEKGTVSPDLERIQRRVDELMRDEKQG